MISAPDSLLVSTLSRSATAITALAATAATACGGGSASNGTSHRASAPGTRPSQIYHLALSGRAEPAPGAPDARGAAVIAFHGSGLVCWRFAHLHGFIDATSAQIGAGRPRKTGTVVARLGAGPRLHHQGCEPIAVTTGARIVRRPSGFYVNIASRRQPAGAVRAQL